MTAHSEQLAASVVNRLRMHKRAAFALPAPDERERFGTIRDRIGASTTAKFQTDGILVQRERLGNEYVTDGHWWSMERRAHEYLHENYEAPTTTPCGCSNGIRTVTSGTIQERFSVPEPETTNAGYVVGAHLDSEEADDSHHAKCLVCKWQITISPRSGIERGHAKTCEHQSRQAGDGR